MSDFRQKDQDPSGILPRPELNPLVNPLLENHLGEWAEVYFTSPPAERERAVEELLRELQRAAQSEPDGAVAGAELTPSVEVVCLDCRFKNFPGQRFCGNCGAPLEETSVPIPVQSSETVIPLQTANSSRTDPPDDPNAIELQWLRQKAFSQWDEVESPAMPGKRLLLASLALVVVAGAWVCFRWLRIEPTPPSAPAASTIPAKTEAETASQPAPPEQAPVPATDQPKQRSIAVLQPPSRPHPAVEDGAQEVLLARQVLDSGNGSRDSSQAAKLLWKAVGKQNVQAALILSDLYARGDGVTRSCDQARLLLVAAAKKGSPAAAQQLRSLEFSGCR